MHCPLRQVVVGLFLVAGTAAALPSAARGSVVYSQTPPHAGGFASDRDFNEGVRSADDFTPAMAATVRSVRWRGVFLFDNAPVFPLSFDVAIFGDSAGLPNSADVRGSTTVTFATSADVDIVDTSGGIFPDAIYEFEADLPATPLNASTKYWFSPLADTSNTSGNNWFWASGISGDPTAFQGNVDAGSGWTPATNGPFYFVLDSAPVPEPLTGLALLLAFTCLPRSPRRHRSSR
jgi:hypothetical protein